MALRLRIVSDHAGRLGEKSTKVFGVHGGTIGRATDNEWILPDPERYLSGKHARVDFRAGTYVLVDTSSNGTYVNGAQVPLGKYHDYTLKDGDYVRLGEYELLVSIDKSNDFPPEEGAIVAYDGQSPSSAVKKSTAHDLGADLSAFCRGAGIDPQNISTEARAAALQLAGQLLREAVLGLMDLNQSRNEFRNRFRISPPANDGPESPLNFSRGVDEALLRLLTTVSTRAGAVEAIRQNFRELKAQNTASLTATRAAFEEFLGRVDPKELEERFERATKRGVFGSSNKSKYWDLYAEMFPGLVQRPADGFPHLFTETFAKAYEAKLRLLVPPRRGFGADRDGEAAQQAVDSSDQAIGDV